MIVLTRGTMAMDVMAFPILSIFRIIQKQDDELDKVKIG
jgi:hypothetical protein